MDTKKKLGAIVLAFGIALSACGKTPQAAQPENNPDLQAHGTIENGIYENTWLNLTYKTMYTPDFLEEYNQISYMADPALNRWCELHEFNNSGESLLLTAEKIPEGKSFDAAADERKKELHHRLNLTDPEITISVEMVEENPCYTFCEIDCKLYHYKQITKNGSIVLEEKNDVMLFWQKDGYLITLRQQSLGDDPFSKIALFQPIIVQEEATEPEVFDILKAPSTWEMLSPTSHNAVLQFALLPDGDSYLYVNYVPIAVIGFTGTYSIDENILSITMDFQRTGAYEVRYAVDGQAQTLTQLSQKGALEDHKAGDVFSYYQIELTPESVAANAVATQRNPESY